MGERIYRLPPRTFPASKVLPTVQPTPYKPLSLPRLDLFNPSPNTTALFTLVRIVSLNDPVGCVPRFGKRPAVELNRIAMLTRRFPNLNEEPMIVRCSNRFDSFVKMKTLPMTHC
jgi:hypothetical protein